MKEVFIVALGVFLGAVLFVSTKKAYDAHCTDIPFFGTYCAAKIGPPTVR